jgi:hypothetical protein
VVDFLHFYAQVIGNGVLNAPLQRPRLSVRRYVDAQEQHSCACNSFSHI